MGGNESGNYAGRCEMIVFLIFLVFGFFLTLHYILGRLDPFQDERISNPISLSIKIHEEFIKLLKSGELLIPKGLFISDGHLWYKALPGGNIKIGIDDFTLKLLGKIDKIKLNSPGEILNKRGGMCVIKQGRKKLKFCSPIEGTIIQVNDALNKKVETLLADPYEQGWLYIAKPAIDVTYLSQEGEIDIPREEWMKGEIEKLSDFVVREYPSRKKLDQMLQKDKVPLDGLLQNMDGYAWYRFQENFLR
jgi:glycine cleavage system H lipoate-binding protein